MERRQEVKRKWAKEEREAERRGWLVERSERGWVTRKGVVSVVTCGYCGEKGTSVGTNYVRLNSVHDMWCEKCGPRKEWLDKEVAAGRKSKMKCTECGKKWVAAKRKEVEEGECGECNEAKRRKEAAHPNKGKAQQKEMRSMETKKEVKREWHWREKKAAKGGYLVERKERGWIERKGERWCAVSLVTCRYCG